MQIDAPEDAAEGSASDPLADLLFTLIAAVLPAILLLAPLTETIGRGAQRRETARRAAEAHVGATLRGVPVRPMVAGAEGLQVGGPGGRRIGLDGIGDDAGLAAALDGMRRGEEPLLLLVEPDGQESAFLLEAVAAAHGPAQFDEVRLTVPCARVAEPALRILCGGAS